MAIRNWYVGKIALLWAWCIGLCLVLVRLIVGTPKEKFVRGFILIGLVLALLIALSVITWKWFTGKDTSRHDT